MAATPCAFSVSEDLGCRRGEFSRKHYGSVELLISSDADGAIQRAGRFRVENGSSDEGTQKICLPYSPTKTLSVKSILSAMSLEKFEKGPREIFHPDIQKDLLVLEEQEGSVNFKFGVLYAKDGQLTDDEMFSNGESFTFSLIDVFLLRILSFFADDTTGTFSIYTVYQGHEIMFHVSTMLPYSRENRQQVERKRHIGNDIVTIVFQEGEETAPAFKPSMIRSHFTHIFALVRYNKQNDSYSKSEFAVPNIDSVVLAIVNQEDSYACGECAVINGEKATLETPTFSQKRQRTLDMLIRSLYQDLMPDLHKNMLNRRSFSDVLPESPKSTRKKEEARQAEFVRLGQVGSIYEPWESQSFCSNFPHEVVCADSWGQSLLVSTDAGILLIDDGQTTVQVFDKTLQIKQMHVLESLDYLIARTDKGKDSRLLVFRLSSVQKDIETKQVIRSKYDCRENKLERTKGCHLYAINTHHSSELRIVVAIRNKLLLITKKYNPCNSLTGSSLSLSESPVEEFQYIREICLSDPPVVMTLVDGPTGDNDNMICVAYRHQFDLVNESTGESYRLHHIEANKVNFVAAIDVYEDGEAGLLLCYNCKYLGKTENDRISICMWNSSCIVVQICVLNSLSIASELEGSVTVRDEFPYLYFCADQFHSNRLTTEPKLINLVDAKDVCQYRKVYPFNGGSPLIQPSAYDFHFSWNQVPYAVVCAFPYILAFTTDSIEIRLVVNGNLVHTAVVPELQLVASRSDIYFKATAAVSGSSHSSSKEMSSRSSPQTPTAYDMPECSPSSEGNMVSRQLE
ncbi:hypothetical protein CIB84_002438 [Bambusicola thoracicus]|uniref:CNH domain-containing protein n=1 Tax=Bambusicola thoracicus TaxID=9083 RepID=A0A2P4TBR3_BAMTH|nr:hypothetical protein CIB84_002438 [Bambusicola thoracicus]